MKTLGKISALAVAGLLGLAACGSDAEETADGLTPLTVYHITTVDSTPLYLGVEEGFFEEEGLDVEVKIALDIDAGLRLAGQHVGPKRSPLHEADRVLELARAVVARPGFRLAGVMTYEGQVAGVPDDVPGERAKSAIVRRLKRASMSQLRTRRAEIATPHGA